MGNRWLGSAFKTGRKSVRAKSIVKGRTLGTDNGQICPCSPDRCVFARPVTYGPHPYRTAAGRVLFLALV